MKNTKYLLRHEILNQLTMVRFLISTESAFEESKKEEIEGLIHLSSMLIAHEDFFVEGKTNFFVEKFDLRELMEIVLFVHENDIKKSKVTVKPLEAMAEVEADRNMVKETLEVILKQLFKMGDSVELSFDSNSRELLIKHDGPDLKIKPLSIIECIKEKKIHLEEKILLITVRLAEGTGVQVRSKEGEVRIKFTGFLYEKPKEKVLVAQVNQKGKP